MDNGTTGVGWPLRELNVQIPDTELSSNEISQSHLNDLQSPG